MRSYKKVFKESSMGTSLSLDELKVELSKISSGNKNPLIEVELMSRPTGLVKGVGINLKGNYAMVFYPNNISFLNIRDKDNSFYLFQGFYYLEINNGNYVITHGGATITLYI